MFANKSLFIGFMIFIMADSLAWIHSIAHISFAVAGIAISLISIVKISFGNNFIEKCIRISYFKIGLVLFTVYMIISLMPYDMVCFVIALLSITSLIISMFLEKGEIRNVNLYTDKKIVKKLMVVWVANLILILSLALISESLDIGLLIYIIYALVLFAAMIWIYPISKVFIKVLKY